ncbi:hypothetical protein QBC32DRAFT_327148, partial [Pseudoneurospora amorphoporcata]
MDIYLLKSSSHLSTLRSELSSDMEPEHRLDFESILGSFERKLKKLKRELYWVNERMERMRESYEELNETLVAIDGKMKVEREKIRLLSGNWAGKRSVRREMELLKGEGEEEDSMEESRGPGRGSDGEEVRKEGEDDEG